MSTKRAKRYEDIPLSEDTNKIDDDWTKKQCIAELRRVAELDETKVVTRNYFRVNGRIKESVWNRHFGTFEEFKRAARIMLSRHQHRHERAIAKHASVEAFEAMNRDKRGYEDRYQRPDSRRYQTLLHVTDLHDRDCDPFWLRVVQDTIKRVQPEKIVIGGDLFDLPEFGKYTVDPREWDVVGRIRAAHAILRSFREAAPSSEIVLVEGNHEFRLLRHLAEATPAMRTVLSDLHGFTVPKLLGLDEFEVNFLARSDLAIFTERDIRKEVAQNYHIAWGCYLTHHFPEGARMGLPGANGHHHRHRVDQYYSPTYGPYQWSQLGCGHRRQATFCAGEQWGLGFQLSHVDIQRLRVADEYIQIGDHAVVGGRFYTRSDDEN